MTPKEALREICLSSHCVSEKLRIDLKPYQITERKNIIYNALTELEELKRDVARYNYLRTVKHWEVTEKEWETILKPELEKLDNKLMKVGKEK